MGNERLYDDMKRLVEYYNRKLKEDDGALAELLVKLAQSDKEIGKRYAAVALRNEYIRLSKAHCEEIRRRSEFGEIASDFTMPDLQLDIKYALRTLSEKERNLVLLRFFWGFSVAEIAALCGVSRQAVNRSLKRVLDKMRPML